MQTAGLLEYLIILSRYYYLISLANLVDSHVIVPLSLFVPLHTFMATSSLSAGLQTPIGYGPMQASAAQFIPEFGGDRKTFADFDFKLKAVAAQVTTLDLTTSFFVLKSGKLPIELFNNALNESVATVTGTQRKLDSCNLCRGHGT